MSRICKFFHIPFACFSKFRFFSKKVLILYKHPQYTAVFTPSFTHAYYD